MGSTVTSPGIAMSIDRLAQLENQYEMLLAQLNEKEVTQILNPDNQIVIQQYIDNRITPQLKKCKQKYLEALAGGTTIDALTEKQAKVVVGEIVEELTIAKNAENLPEIMVDLMEQILVGMNEPDAAVLRLKVGVKLPFEFFEAGAELEGNAGAFWRKYCPTFESWRVKAKKLFPPM